MPPDAQSSPAAGALPPLPEGLVLEPAQQLGAGEGAICKQGEEHLNSDPGTDVRKDCPQEHHCPVVADSQEVGQSGNREIQRQKPVPLCARGSGLSRSQINFLPQSSSVAKRSRYTDNGNGAGDDSRNISTKVANVSASNTGKCK